MLDPKLVTDQLEDVRARLARRSSSAAALLDDVAEAAKRRRHKIAEVEKLQAERNAANQQMSALAKSPDKAAFAAHREQLKTLTGRVKTLEAELAEVEAELEEKLLVIPNLPHDSTPVGQGEADNPVVRTWGEKPELDFEPKEHDAIADGLGILDLERAAKLSGARFSVLYGKGAKLSRALTRYMLDLHTEKHGYLEVAPPYLVRASALRGTGQLPKFEKDLFKTQKRGPEDESDVENATLYLIPTAEVPVTNLHADEILEASQLPLAYTAFTPCFRSEAGSHGKDVKGLIRQHQFDKVELVRFVTPESALDELEKLTGHAEAVLQGLGLHYRVSALCTGDISGASEKTYDLEVWLPGQNAYREISSCSSFGDYQARRAKIRYRPAPKEKPRLVNTLNGSGVAVGRTLVAILEQYQQKDGSVRIPEALVPYVGFDRIEKAC
jgi:seryl-tRNA synthetase